MQQHPEPRGRGLPARAPTRAPARSASGRRRHRAAGRPCAARASAAASGDRRVAGQRRDRDRHRCEAGGLERHADDLDAERRAELGERRHAPRPGARRPRRARDAEFAEGHEGGRRRGAGADDAGRARRRRRPPRARARTMPPTSVLKPRGPSPVEQERVDGAGELGAAVARRHAAANATPLSGIVSDRPRHCAVESGELGGERRPRRRGGARSVQSSPSTRYAAACSCGERLCAIGVAPDLQPRAVGLSIPRRGCRCTTPATGRRRGCGRRRST